MKIYSDSVPTTALKRVKLDLPIVKDPMIAKLQSHIMHQDQLIRECLSKYSNQANIIAHLEARLNRLENFNKN